jgi:hypothetical protein
MKKIRLYLILLSILYLNLNITGQKIELLPIDDQISNKAQTYAHKILSNKIITIVFHAIYYNADETPRIYVFTCNYTENEIQKNLTLYLSTDSLHSLTTFYFDKPIDKKITIPYEKLIICNQGIVLKIYNSVFKKYPDYTPITKEELFLYPPGNSYPTFPTNSIDSIIGTKLETSNIKKSTTEDKEVNIANVPIYLWYLNCGLITGTMYIGYWNDQGYSNLIPGGNSNTGYYWAVTEESCFWGEGPDTDHNSREGYYAQAAEYGNNISTQIIMPTDNSWNSYQNLIDTYNRPIYVGWQGSPYGAHATLGVGYKLIDDTKYFILHDTWYDTPSYVSYNEYSASVSGYYYWYPTSEAQTCNFNDQSTEASVSEIILNVKDLNFSPSLESKEYAYHHFEFADLNNDNKTDIIVCNFRNLGGGRWLLLYYNNGTSYTLKEDFNPVFEWYECLNVARAYDFDNDGDLDILVTGYWSIVRIFVNDNGNINPEPIVLDNIGRGFIDCDYGDFDQDRDIDIIASTVDGKIRLYENNEMNFTTAYEFNVEGQSFKIRFADINNDNFPEIIASKRNGTIVIFKNDNGLFYSETSIFSPVGHGGMSFDCGDVDNDGWMDIITVKDGALILYKNTYGTFTDVPLNILSPEAYPKSITLKNLDEDVYPELIIGNFNRPNFILQNTDGNFGSKAAWLATDTDPTFSINTYKYNSTNTILIAFGKSRGGNIEFLETNAITTLDYTIIAIPRSGGNVAGAGDYGEGQICNLTATAATGYNFVNWTEAGNEVSTNSEYSFTVNKDRSLIAHFKLKNISITAIAEPVTGGQVSGAGNYEFGQNCNLIATPYTGYNFVNWTEAGIEVSTNLEFNFTVIETRNFTANFKNTTNSLVVNANDIFIIYPNPSSGIIYIRGEINSEIKILNCTGQVIRRATMYEKEINIDLSRQEKGIYLLEYITKNEALVKKVVLK